MSNGQRKSLQTAVLVIVIGLILGVSFRISHTQKIERTLVFVAPAQPKPTLADQREEKIQRAIWDVAKVFGRDSGCKDADPELGRLVAETAVDEGIKPSIVAATVAIESKCNPFATSSRGAIGLMQVMPTIWKESYDFQNKVNLLNPRDNVRTGAHILASYIKSYGESDGIVHYQGTGSGCLTCNDSYASMVLKLATGK
jgi:Transglycosylase SLT domain